MSISSTCYTFHRSNWLRWAPPPSRSRARSLMWEIKSSPDITLICQSHTRSHFPTRDCTKNELFFEREKKKSHTFFHSRTRRRAGEDISAPNQWKFLSTSGTDVVHKKAISSWYFQRLAGCRRGEDRKCLSPWHWCQNYARVSRRVWRGANVREAGEDVIVTQLLLHILKGIMLTWCLWDFWFYFFRLGKV